MVNVSLVSVSDDLSGQVLQVNCYTYNVRPDQVTWTIGSEPIASDSSFQAVNGSKLLDSDNQTFRHYLSLNGSFSNGTIVACNVNVNGKTEVKKLCLTRYVMHEDHAAMTSNVIIFLKLNTYLLLVLSINYIYIVSLISSHWIISCNSVSLCSTGQLEPSIRYYWIHN